MLLFLKDMIFLATEKFDPWTMYIYCLQTPVLDLNNRPWIAIIGGQNRNKISSSFFVTLSSHPFFNFSP